MKNENTTPEKEAQRAKLVRSVFWVMAIAIMFGCVYAFKPIIDYLFPRNMAVEMGWNPVTLSQIPPQQAATVMLHMTFMPYTGFHHPANVEVNEVFRGNYPYHWKTNNYGFLSDYEMHPFDRNGFSKGPQDKVVLYTGGSGAYGWGSSSNETAISYVLERLLNKGDPSHHWHVINLAMGAWIAYQEFLSLDLYGTEFNPDWVVVYDGRNDMIVPTIHGEQVPNYYFYQGQKKLNNLFEAEAGGSWVDRLPLMRYRKLSQRIADIARTPPSVVNPEEVSKAVRFYVHSLGLIGDRFRNQKLLFVMQATTFFLRDPYIVTPGYNEARSMIQSMVKKLPDAQFEDSNNYFKTRMEGDGDFVDDCHLTDQGQATVAAHIAENILAREKIKGASATRKPSKE